MAARRGRGDDSGLVTLEWVLIVGTVAALAAVVFWLVWSSVEDNAADIAESDHFPAAVLAAAHITADARAALPALVDPVAIDEVNQRYGAECRRLQIAYLDIELRSRWVDADADLRDRFDVFNGVDNPPPRALCLVGAGGEEPVVPLEEGVLLGPRISVDDVTGVEGDIVHFTVSLNVPSTRTVAVDYHTFAYSPRPGIAQEGLDYSPVTGSLTFGPGVQEQTVSVALRVDGLTEIDETFELRLDNPRRASIFDGRGTGTIEDTPAQALRISAATSVEGGTLEFRVDLGGGTAQRNVTVGFETVTRLPGAGVASTPGDFRSRSGVVTIFQGQSSVIVRVQSVDDRLDEDVENFDVRLRDPVNAVIAVGEAAGTIIDNDDPPRLSVNGSEAREDGGPMVFEVRLSAPSGRTVTARISTADGTASAPGDYHSRADVGLSFEPLQTSVTVPVTLEDDNVPEPPERFTMMLSDVENARPGSMTAQGLIIDDDSGPTLLVDDADPVIEGEVARFTVRLSRASNSAVRVEYETADGTAVAPGDYHSRASSLTFARGETSLTVEVSTVDDATPQEPDELFELRLTRVTSGDAQIGDASATGWIIDNDHIPEITVDDTSAVESGSAIFTVRLSRESGQAVTVNWVSALDSLVAAERRAVAPLDFALVSGSATFAPGETTVEVTVPLEDDELDEYDETFWLRLGGAVGGTVTDGTAIGTIRDDDPEPSIEVRPAEATEGEPVLFEVRLEPISGRTVTTHFATVDGSGGASAIDGIDYFGTDGDLWFAPGVRSLVVPVETLDDLIPEESETFLLQLSRTANARIQGGTAVGTIHDNEVPILSIADVVVVEGDEPAAVFVASIDSRIAADVTFDYATITGSARPGGDCDDPNEDTDDYLPLTGRATIPAGDTETTISVTVCDDIVIEEDEDFVLRLTNPNGAQIVDEFGAVATIIDNDGAPRLVIEDAEAVEADGTIDFPVRLSHESTEDVTVEYATFDGTAVQPDDYLAARGTITFAAGETEAAISVTLTDDPFVEDPPFESFTVVLSLPDPLTARLFRDTALGLILDDDVPPTFHAVDAVANEDDGSVAIRVALSYPNNEEIRIPFRTRSVYERSRPSSWHYDYGDEHSTYPFYQSRMGELVFPPGVDQAEIDVVLIDNDYSLTDQIGDGFTYHTVGFNVDFPNPPVRCSLGCTARVLVRDDEQLHRVRFAEVEWQRVAENAGSVVLALQLYPGVAAREDVTVTYSVEPTSAAGQGIFASDATPGVDYVVPSPLSVTFPAGAATAVITIPILDDTDLEGPEGIAVALTGVVGDNAEIVSYWARKVVIILDDEELPEVSVSNAAAPEDAGPVRFVALLDNAHSSDVTVNFGTADGTATAGDDYTGVASGSVTIPAGDLFAAIEIDVVDDAIAEGSETFTLQLTGVTGATLANTEAEGTIHDSGLLPTLTLSGRSVVEDDGLSPNAIYFFVHLSEASAERVTVTIAATDVPSLGANAATRHVDYTGRLDLSDNPFETTLTIDPGRTRKSIFFHTVPDQVPERDERFLVTLYDAENATIAVGEAWGTILNNDQSIVDVPPVRASEGAGSVTFTLQLHEPSLDPTSLRYSTAAWPWAGEVAATPGEDYTVVTGGMLNIPAGDTTAEITVPILDDSDDEYDEALVLRLHDPDLLTLGVTHTVAIIEDDDPGWWIGDTSATEGGSLLFPVENDPPAGASFTLQYEVSDGAAVGGTDCADSGVDYLIPSGSVTFAPGATDATISVTVCDDATIEGAETLVVELLDVTGRRTTATGTIASSD